jgi:SpoVK/Ycf46/Vps4 family AAA+-type ATPase
VIVMKNNCLVEFDDSYCEVLHDGNQQIFLDELTTVVTRFKQRERRQPLEINVIAQDRHKLYLKSMEIKRAKLDLDLFYEDDFKETDDLIRKRLRQKDDKGIVLLHGLPGTGKTSYLRYLIGKIRKRVLFLSPTVADNLTNPDFIQLLIGNPNTVLIIEDAENIIMDRKYNSGSSVSNLLNISDGLLADFLNVQLVCTFNSSVTLIDSAMMRKGRLIAKYEFGRLSIAKAQKLSRHFGFDTIIDKPMTVAEIANQHEKEQMDNRIEIIGFKREIIGN